MGQHQKWKAQMQRCRVVQQAVAPGLKEGIPSSHGVQVFPVDLVTLDPAAENGTTRFQPR
jgi:hypothetical protein